MKTFLIFLSLLVVAACDGAGSAASGADLHIVTQGGEKFGFEIEIAMTPAQMQKGLMLREHLDQDRGMLFWFGQEAERGFWMKNTLIPLDLIFIRLDGTILSIKQGKPHDETNIPSGGPAAAVLEINAGLSEKLGIKPGDTVHFPFFGNALAD